jgi:hypothetical protein
VDEPTNIVHVPKPSPASFNPDRPLRKNSLLESQVRHCREIEEKLPPQKLAAKKFQTIETEGQAAEYIKHVTLRLHKRKARKQKAG